MCVCVCAFSPEPPPVCYCCISLTYLCVCVSLPSTCVCMEGFCFPPYCCISYNIVCARVCVYVRLAPKPPQVLLLYFFSHICVYVYLYTGKVFNKCPWYLLFLHHKYILMSWESLVINRLEMSASLVNKLLLRGLECKCENITSESRWDVTCDSLGDVTWSHGTHDVKRSVGKVRPI